MRRGAGRVHWALYRDAACSESSIVLRGSLSINHVQPSVFHAVPNSSNSALNPAGILLAPVLQRHLLAQLRAAGNGESNLPSMDICNDTVQVGVEDLALGSRVAKLGLDSKASLYCRLELQAGGFEAEDVEDTDWFSWKIMRAFDYRVRGNEAFKVTEYGTALRLYKRALTWLKRPISLSDSKLDPKIQYSQEESRQVNRVAVACYANMCTCYLKLKGDGSIDRCIAAASRALELDSTHVKARYRRSLAYVASKDLGLAVADLTKLCELEPNNKLFRSTLIKTQATKSQLRKKQQAAFANLCSD